MKYLPFGEKKLMKISPVDPEIIGLQAKKLWKVIYIAWLETLASRLKSCYKLF